MIHHSNTQLAKYDLSDHRPRLEHGPSRREFGSRPGQEEREREIKTSREKEAVECGTDTLQKIELPKLKSNKQRRDDEDQSRGPKYSLPSAMNPVARLSTTTKTQKHPWMIEVQQLRSPAICTESSGGP